jgi:adenine-specific DNA methylase
MKERRGVRRLIETDEMPIGVISEHSRKDQNVRKGHLHTLHVWWATRPLASCRAVLMATILPDPADENCPEDFRREAQEALKDFNWRSPSDPLGLRKALLEFIAHFAAWENSNNPNYVKTARRLVRAAHPDGPPLVVDPFAGIGSIPFEALRIGADAFAGDLNPVAVLLNKVALEYLPTYGQGGQGRPPLHEAVRKWGEWVRARAIEELRPFYPLEPDGSEPLAYLWARTIRCEGPDCGAEVPLVGLLWLSRREKHRVALRYQGDRARKEVVFEIFQPKSESEVQPPIVKRFSATCPVCGYTTPYARVREQIRARQGGTRDARLIAVITLRRDGSRGFRLAAEQDVAIARRATEELARRQAQHPGPLPLVPDEVTPAERGPGASRGSGAWQWNFWTWGDLFTPRQALALSTFVRLVREAHQEVLQETGDAGFARAVATCLAVAVSNMSQYLCATAFYMPEYIRSPFWGSAFPMRADFADVNPFVSAEIGPAFHTSISNVVALLEQEAENINTSGTVRQGSATAIPLPDQSVPYVVTDPPYYDAITYADLSDLCFVWLKRMLGDLHPDLFRWPLTPKAEECIADPGPPPPGLQPKTREFFERTIEQALAECRRVLRPDGVAVILFAHKGTAGWEALLNALVRAGWTVTGSWPIETERAARMQAKNAAVLASSVFLVCRPRPENVGVGDWRRVLEEMHRKVAAWLPRLEKEGIHGADAIFACIGPALEVYSRYERVETASGQMIPLGDVSNSNSKIIQRGYLSYVWEAVAREALKDFPTDEPDARVTGFWLWTLRGRINGAVGEANEEMVEEDEGEETGKKKFSGYALPYDDARLIIQVFGAHEDRLRRPGGILEVKGNTARLVAVAERRRFLFGQTSGGGETPRRRRRGQPSLFEELAAEPEPEMVLAPSASTLDRLHQAMLLFADGRSEALRRFLVDERVGRDVQFWRLADALSRLYPMNSQEKRWVDGLLARKKGLGL